MERGRLAGIGCVLGVVALFGCAPPPPAPQAVAAPPPAASAPVALVPSPAPVAMALPPPPPPPAVGAAMPGHQAVSVAHRAIHHHWVRRYASLGAYPYGPPCGSVAHPCSVSHIVVAIQ